MTRNGCARRGASLRPKAAAEPSARSRCAIDVAGARSAAGAVGGVTRARALEQGRGGCHAMRHARAFDQLGLQQRMDTGRLEIQRGNAAGRCAGRLLRAARVAHPICDHRSNGRCLAPGAMERRGQEDARRGPATQLVGPDSCLAFVCGCATFAVGADKQRCRWQAQFCELASASTRAVSAAGGPRRPQRRRPQGRDRRISSAPGRRGSFQAAVPARGRPWGVWAARGWVAGGVHLCSCQSFDRRTSQLASVAACKNADVITWRITSRAGSAAVTPAQAGLMGAAHRLHAPPHSPAAGA
jgi:hypothetical protein